MKGVIGIAISAQFSIEFIGESLCNPFGNKNQVARPFAEVKPSAVFIKGLTEFLVEDHQGIKPIECKACKGVSPSGNDHIQFVMTDHSGPMENGICRGGT